MGGGGTKHILLERGDNPEKRVEMGEIDVEMGVATFLSLYSSIRFTAG